MIIPTFSNEIYRNLFLIDFHMLSRCIVITLDKFYFSKETLSLWKG